MRNVILLLLAAMAINASSQSKINAYGRLQINKERRVKTAIKQTLGTTSASPRMVNVIVATADGADPSAIADGHSWAVKAITPRHATVTLPIDSVEALSELRQVSTVTFPSKRRLLMNRARAASGVDAVHSGITHRDNLLSFNGSGVITGLMDGGLDANHINFQNADGSSRVKRLWHFVADDYGYLESTNEYTDATVSEFESDDKLESHATHVAGIMAGGYRGTSTYMNVTNASTGASTKTTGAMPFYGVAPGSELALSVGDLYDDIILEGVTKIADYAKEQGKPAVINLSLGSNSGPHDGTDDFSQALDELGKRAVICVAAGNEGDTNIAIEKTFTSTDKSVKTLLYYNNRIVSSNLGYLDIWASDGQPLTVTIANVSSSGSLSNSVTVSKTANDQTISTPCKSSSSNGYIYATAGVDKNSGRYNVLLDFDYALPKSGRFSITVTGAAGQTVNMWFDGYSQFTNSYSNNSTTLSGFTAGSTDGTISGMACGKNVISVGAYSTLADYVPLGGNTGYDYSTGETVGSIVSYSSYGHDFWGNQLPHIVAPGSTLASSYSSYYIASNEDGYTSDDMLGSATASGKTHYWGAMEGTSMATPFVSGVVALWLEADPTLTVDDIKEIMAKTARNDDNTAEAAERSGFGKIDAERGLIEVLDRRLTAIDGIQADADALTLVRIDGSTLEVFMAGSDATGLTLCDMQGRVVRRLSVSGDRLNVAVGDLSGIFVARVEGSRGVVTRKVAL